jgi:hypothetical protein
MGLFNFLFVCVFIFVLTIAVLRTTNHYNVPTLASYLRQNPDYKTSRGPRCRHCGSTSISRSFYGQGALSKQYKHSCRACGKTLYRTSV